MCPYCSQPGSVYAESTKSPLNGTVYKLFFCPNCRIQYFTPLKFENIYEAETAGLYNRFHAGREIPPSWSKEIIRVIAKLRITLNNLKVMDIGAGDGINFDLLTRNGLKSENYYAYELDGKSVAAAVRRGIVKKNITQKFFGTKNAGPGNKFDIVIASEVLEHQTDPKDFIRACFEILKPAGIVILTVPDRNRLFLKMRSLSEDTPPHHFLRFSREFFTHNFKNRLTYLGVYSHGWDDISLASKAVCQLVSAPEEVWPVFVLPILILRLADIINGVGLVAVIRK